MLSTQELLKRVRKIEIKTRNLSNHIFAGEYHSAFKGRGMSFSEVREYTVGDDVKAIDWNVTARQGHPYIKVFEEERELTVMLIVDISASTLFGSAARNKRELITEICAVIGFSALTNNDKVGMIFFSDKVEQYIPPKKGKSHLLHMIRELIALEPKHQSSTNIQVALDFLNRVMKKKCITFLLSDFISAPYEQPLQITARKHDLVGMQVYDTLDKNLPKLGVVQMLDAENGQLRWVDTDDKKTQIAYTSSFLQHQKYSEQVFRKSGATLLQVTTVDDYVKVLQGFFKNR